MPVLCACAPTWLLRHNTSARMMITLALALLGLNCVASAPARLHLANEALKTGGVLDTTLSREEAVALLRRLNRVPPLAPPLATVLLLSDGAHDAKLEVDERIETASTVFEVDNGFALFDAFARRTEDAVYCAEGVTHSACRSWKVERDLSSSLKNGERAVYVLPRNQHGLDLVRKVDVNSIQVVSLAGSDVLQNELAIPETEERFLLESDGNGTSGNGTTGFTVQEINTFQINLWTAVLLICIALAAVYALVFMDVVPDSLLYAKFQADVSGFKTD